jgi:hypothetical protein
VAEARKGGSPIPKVELDSARDWYTKSMVNIWETLGIAPPSLATAKSESEKEKLASKRVTEYFQDLLAQRAQPVPFPPPHERALREKYGATINTVGLNRAVDIAQKMRAKSDSAGPKQPPPRSDLPKSVIPLPQPKKDTTKK